MWITSLRAPDGRSYYEASGPPHRFSAPWRPAGVVPAGVAVSIAQRVTEPVPVAIQVTVVPAARVFVLETFRADLPPVLVASKAHVVAVRKGVIGASPVTPEPTI